MPADKVILYAVTSSNIHSIGYDPQAQELHIQFTSGSYYIYRDVSLETYEAFRAAKSVGKYFMQNIRNIYEGVKS
ncbi:MAG: KTSC domain-containing protein [Candidatus Micrarchaeia archaeon]|jgi:hypothetical protein